MQHLLYEKSYKSVWKAYKISLCIHAVNIAIHQKINGCVDMHWSTEYAAIATVT